ncbi:MAG: glycerol-3-phosphate acyltransferase [Anaerolineae bacterium]
MLTAVLWLVIGYLCGSLPTAYLVARASRGIDIRQYGSGNAGGSNVMKHVSPAAGIAVGLTDAAKALVPVLLALRFGGPWAAAAAAAGATAGHCWSFWIGFTGGRGMACTAASLLATFLPGTAALIVIHIAGGLLFKRAALADYLALVLLPPLAAALGFGWPVVVQCLLLLAVVSGKRLEANGLPLPADPARRRSVLRYRLLYDRDVSPDEDWMGRTPESDK